MLRRLKVCQVSAAYYPYPSGLSEHVHHLTAALRGRGHEVEILTTSFGPVETPVPGVTRFGRACLVPLNKSFGTVPLGWRMPAQVKQFLRRGQFDIVHLHGAFPPDISFWALHHSQTVNVVTFHTVGFASSRAGAALCRVVMERYNRKLGGRIVESKAALEFTRPFFPGEYRLIPPGVDTNRFRPGVEPIADLTGLRNRVLFVGRLDARKGLPVLLRALVSVRARIPDARLIVVGKGPMDAECRTLARQLGIGDAVDFRGYVAAEVLPSYYASADVYCSPALGGEAFGIVLLEAMAAGVPVVATDITGYNEVVRDGETGLLCRPNSPEALADSLVRALADRSTRQRLASAGRASAEDLSWPRIAARIEEYYADLLDRAARV